MSTIKALVEIEIFDDPEYCNNPPHGTIEQNERCENRFGVTCNIFRMFLKKEEIPGYFYTKYLKCDQCKEVWNDTKNMAVSDIIMKITEAANKLKSD